MCIRDSIPEPKPIATVLIRILLGIAPIEISSTSNANSLKAGSTRVPKYPIINASRIIKFLLFKMCIRDSSLIAVRTEKEDIRIKLEPFEEQMIMDPFH